MPEFKQKGASHTKFDILYKNDSEEFISGLLYHGKILNRLFSI